MKNATPFRRRLLGAGSLLLVISFFFTYWEADIDSSSHLHRARLAARVGQVELALDPPGLAVPGADPAQLATSSAVAAGVALACLAVAAAAARRRFSLLLWLPAIAYPAVVLLDAASWLAVHAGALTTAAAACRDAAIPLWGHLELHGSTFATRPGAGAFLALGAAAVLAAGAAFSGFQNSPRDLSPSRPIRTKIRP